MREGDGDNLGVTPASVNRKVENGEEQTQHFFLGSAELVASERGNAGLDTASPCAGCYIKTLRKTRRTDSDEE